METRVPAWVEQLEEAGHAGTDWVCVEGYPGTPPEDDTVLVHLDRILYRSCALPRSAILASVALDDALGTVLYWVERGRWEECRHQLRSAAGRAGS